MQFADAYSLLGPHTLLSKRKAERLYDSILRLEPRSIFELGFHCGGSTLLMAAALQELGGGFIETYDYVSAEELDPNIFELAKRTGLSQFIVPHFCEWCCEWELSAVLARQSRPNGFEPIYDFAFIDGGHYWTCCTLVFYLVSHLLKPGGWILFDDLTWTISSGEAADARWTYKFPDNVKTVAMVGLTFDLLVSRHPQFGNIHKEVGGDWGWAQKCLPSPEAED